MLEDDLPGAASDLFIRHVLQLCFEGPAGYEELLRVQHLRGTQQVTPRSLKNGLQTVDVQTAIVAIGTSAAKLNRKIY